MRRILYNMKFTGRGEQEKKGEYLWITRSSAPCMRFTTEITDDGVDVHMEEVAGPKAEYTTKVMACEGGSLVQARSSGNGAGSRLTTEMYLSLIQLCLVSSSL